MSEMTRTMVIGKIHRARVTGADLHYVGSITIDEDLLDAANIVPGQKVDIADVNNGSRLSTYTIAGERGSGVIQLNGAAAHLVNLDDLVIIMAYAQVPESQVRSVVPSVVFVDSHQNGCVPLKCLSFAINFKRFSGLGGGNGNRGFVSGQGQQLRIFVGHGFSLRVERREGGDLASEIPKTRGARRQSRAPAARQFPSRGPAGAPIPGSGVWGSPRR